MLFVNKFWSNLNYYSIVHDIPDLFFKSTYLSNMNPANVCLFTVNNLKKVWNMFTVNNIDTSTTPLTSFLCLRSQPFKRQFHKMVKHTQTIRRQIADELFEWVWPFCKYLLWWKSFSLKETFFDCYLLYGVTTRSGFTCSKTTVETPKQCVKSVQS